MNNWLSRENYQKSLLPLFSNVITVFRMAKTKRERTDEDIEIGQNIKRLRKRAGFKNQDELAEIYGRSKNYIGLLEAGFRRPGRATAKKLAKIFKCDMWDILIPPSQYKQEEVRPHRDGEMIPGSYGVPDLSRHRITKTTEQTREETRARMVEQLDKILGHPKFEAAIAANLEAFAMVAEYAAEMTALRKELDELKLQNKILLDEIAKNRRPEGGPERRDLWKNLDKIKVSSGDGQKGGNAS